VVAGGGGLTYLHPLLLVLLALAAWGFVRRRRSIEAIALIGIFAVTWAPLAWVAAQPLEGWYRADPPSMDGAGGIVVLAGGVFPATGGESGSVLQTNTYLRCRRGAWLWKRSPQLPVLVCGGPSFEVPVPAANTMREVMVAEGVPESLVWMEDRSRSTYENALFGAEILRRKGIRRIVLVTEAYHMPRSERAFRKQGIDVIPAPCNFTTVEPGPKGLMPSADAVLTNEFTLHELFGLAWYKIAGRI
jgi:uncharacterized SAM-binding protein YcdF (DUF218 family)